MSTRSLPARSVTRCPRCRCADHAHLSTGCSTTVGFICTCPLTSEQVIEARGMAQAVAVAQDILGGVVIEVHAHPVIEDQALVAEFVPDAPAKPSMEFVFPGERF